MAKKTKTLVAAAAAGEGNGVPAPAIPQFVIEFDDAYLDGVARHYAKCSGKAIPTVTGGDAVLLADDRYAVFALENYLVRIGGSGLSRRIAEIQSAVETFKQYSHKYKEIK